MFHRQGAAVASPVTGSYSSLSGWEGLDHRVVCQLCLKPFQIILALMLPSDGGLTTLHSSSRSLFASQNLFPCGFYPLGPG